jgi:hypothetical protein
VVSDRNAGTIEYFQSNEDDFVFYALQHVAGSPHPLVYVYRKQGFSTNRWEHVDKILDPSGWEYCYEKMLTLSRSTPRDEVFLRENDVSPINQEMFSDSAHRIRADEK